MRLWAYYSILLLPYSGACFYWFVAGIDCQHPAFTSVVGSDGLYLSGDKLLGITEAWGGIYLVTASVSPFPGSCLWIYSLEVDFCQAGQGGGGRERLQIENASKRFESGFTAG